MNLGGGVHLTYCSNIHPGETWPEVRANLQRHVPLVHQQVAPGQAFGIGLRLSAQAAASLAEPAALLDLKKMLAAGNRYVFTLNGFPYGTFHGVAVKETVYLPDWRSPERLAYSNQLADLLAALLPDIPGLEGSVSTVPGAFKAVITSAADVEQMRHNLVAHVAHLVALQRRSGRRITLALEPEPCCYLETIDEAADFFTAQLFGPASVAQLAAAASLTPLAAREALHTHLGLCLDMCHAAVEFEEPAACIARLRAADVRILKVQISAGLRVTRFDAPTLDALSDYAESVYLHQVVQRTGQALQRFTDLPEALAGLERGVMPDEWRVHFHVPVFHKELGLLGSSRDFTEAMLAIQRGDPVSSHLEVETYTWDVLPDAVRSGCVEDAIAQELRWVLGELTA